MDKKKIIFAAVGLLILLIGVPVGIFLAGQTQEIRERAAPATVLSLVPAQKSANVGDTIVLSLVVDTAENTISAAEIHLGFNPAVVEAQSISAGAFLPVILTSSTTDNTTGKASITLGSQPTEPKKGTGTLATITFRVKSSGSANVTFLPQTQVAGIGEQGNVLTNANPSVITITAAPTTTSTTQAVGTTTQQLSQTSPSPSPGAGTSATSTSPSPTATVKPVGGEATASPTSKPTATATTKATSSPITQLPQAGLSWPTISAVAGGALLLVIGILLAF